MPVSADFDAWLMHQEDKERSHKSHFEYTINDYEVSHREIESKLDDLFDEYQWPRLSGENPSQTTETVNG